MLAAFLYLSWKHGFVRADGHMIGFFYAALLTITAFPVLLRDDASMAWMRRWLMAPLGVLCLFGLYNALSGVITETLGVFQGRVFDNVSHALNLEKLRKNYNDRLGEQRGSGDMPKTRAIIGDRSVDVLGYEQSAAIFNRLQLPAPSGLSELYRLHPGPSSAELRPLCRGPRSGLRAGQDALGRRTPHLDGRFGRARPAHVPLRVCAH